MVESTAVPKRGTLSETSLNALRVVAPVPPEATASVDDNPAAVPLVFWFRLGNEVRPAAEPVVVK